MNQRLYTRSDLEAVANAAAQKALASVLNLESRIEQGEEGETVSSKYRETYYFAEKDGTVASVRLAGSSKVDTDQKFLMYLKSRCKATAPLLRDFVEDTYRRTFMRKLSPTTTASYNHYLDRYILPNLGDKHMDQITVTDVQAFYDWMANAAKHGCQNDLNADTITRVSGLLSRLYKIAIEMELVATSPIKKTLLVNEGKEASHHKALPDADVSRIKMAIPAIEDDQERLYMALLAYTGMRREEILGLGWEHINIKERYGRIERTVVFPDGKNAVVRNKTKTKASTREFVISEALAAILEPCQQKTGFIIHGRDPEKPVPLSTFRRMYRKVFKSLGISDYNNHDWRTTFGTQLKEAGITSAQVADLMGHADTRMVEKTYAPTRHEGIMKHKNTLEMINGGTVVAP